jgi:hypothetical protein
MRSVCISTLATMWRSRNRLYSSTRVKELTVWTGAADGPYLPNELTLAVRAKLVRVNARG